MHDRFAALRATLEHAVLEGPAESTADARQKAAAGIGASGELAQVVANIHQHAYKITDEDVATLRQRYSDDVLFEIAVSAALGASRDRLAASLRAMAAAAAQPQPGRRRATSQG